MMSAVKMRTPMDSARSRASRVTGTSNAKMTANFLAPCRREVVPPLAESLLDALVTK